MASKLHTLDTRTLFKAVRNALIVFLELHLPKSPTFSSVMWIRAISLLSLLRGVPLPVWLTCILSTKPVDNNHELRNKKTTEGPGESTKQGDSGQSKVRAQNKHRFNKGWLKL